MEQRKIEVVAGLRFYRLDGELFPVLEGAKGPSAPPPDPGLTSKQNKLLEMQIKNAEDSYALMPLLTEEAGIVFNPTTKKYEYADPNAARQRQQLQSQYTQAQLENLEKSKALEPIMMKQMGLRYDPNTKQYVELNPELSANKQEIERLQTERSLKALKGELPVSETLKRSLDDAKLQNDEFIYRQYGPGGKGSTGGAVKQREFDTMAAMLKEGEQRDMLTTAEALAQQRGFFNQQQAQGYAGAQGVTNANRGFSISDPMGKSAAFENPFASRARMLAPAQQSLASARDQDNFTRSMIFEKNKLAGQERAGYISAGIGAAGMAGGLFMMSDPDVKTDIEPVSDAALLAAVTKIPVKKWKYKDDPEGREHIGGMADTMPDVVSDGRMVDVISYIGMLTGAVRELNRKISADEEISPAMALAF